MAYISLEELAMIKQQPLPNAGYASKKLNVLAVILALSVVYGGVGGLCAFAGGPPPDPPEYEVTVIPGPFCGIFGYEPANGWGINDLGNICGDERNCNLDWEAFFWSPETGRIVLNLPPGTIMSRAQDLNSNNMIVGWMEVSNDGLGFLAFLHDGEQYTNLGTLSGGNWSEAHAINEKNEIVGFWGDTLNGPSPLAFLWRDGHMIDIHPDFGTTKSEANDINDISQATGWMGNSTSSDAHAFIWDDGKVTDLGVIPGGFTAEGIAINNQGDVAVEGRTFNDNKEVIVRSFLWRDGQWIDIGGFPGCEDTRILDVNDAGQVIGYCEGPGVFSRFLWEDGVIWELNDLVDPDDPDFDFISLVHAINNSAQIAGSVSHFEFGGAALRLTRILPIPGDLDGDGIVNITDLLILLSSWGCCGDCNNCPADLDETCSVSTTDLLILFANWG